MLTLLASMFIRQLSHIFNRQENDISNLSLKKCSSRVSNVTQANDYIIVLKHYAAIIQTSFFSFI